MTTWTADQRYCTAWGIAAILAFLALALYLDPIDLTQINLFNSKECENYSRGAVLSQQDSAKATPTKSQNKSSNDEDYYSCRLASYTCGLELFTAALVVATISLFIIGI
jgi:hypothetical protein